MARKRRKRPPNDPAGATAGAARIERLERVDMAGRTLSPSYRRQSEPPQHTKIRRSDMIWLVLVGAVVIAPAIYEATGTPIRRNLYARWADCVDDYSANECEKHDAFSDPDPSNDQSHSRYHGPWYREGSRSRSAEDPGPGRHYEQSGNSSDYRHDAAGGGARSSPPTATEPGTLRGGFGRTANVRSSRWSFGG